MTISRTTPVLCCVIHLYFCVFFRARFMLSLRDRFCFFSISNSTLLFEQSSHFLTLTVLCRQTKPVNFCWFRFFSRTSFVERMSSCCLLFSCVCFSVVVFFLPSCSRSFLFLRTLYYISMFNIVFSLFVFFFIIIFLLLLSVDFNQDLLC